MTSVASEAFALLNRPSPSSRPASARSGQTDGGFAELIENATEPREAPKPARSERSERVPAQRAERETSADKSAHVEPTGRSNDAAPAGDQGTKAADHSAGTPGAEAAAAQPAEETAPVTQDKAEGTPVVTIILPALPVEVTPTVAVVAAPVTAAPVEAPTTSVQAAPIPAATGPASAIPALAPSTPVPGEQPAEASGELTETAATTAAPATTLAAPATTLAAPGQQQAAAANAAPQVKAQSAAKTETLTDGEAVADAQTSVQTSQGETLQTETAEDAAKHAKQPAVQTATPAQAQTAADKPDLKAEHGFKRDDIAATPKLADQASSQVPTHMPAHATAAGAATPQASPFTTAQAVPLNAIAVEIAGQAKAGHTRFEIRLDPAELGRIDVRLDVDRDGNVTSRLVIERADTYDLLRRDQSTLERALQQAGLKTSENALEFSLRDQGFAQQQRQNDDTPRGVRAIVAESDIMPSEAANGYARLLGGRSGVDIRV